MDILEKLNDKQQEAVLTTEGPLLILAGAGSGKTTTVMTRIAHILKQKLARPQEILAITFTNKAAREMRERLGELYPGDTEGSWIMTFHAACARILRYYGDRLGYESDFSILDAQDQRSVYKRIINDLRIAPETGITPGSMVGKVSKLKTKNISPEKFRESANDGEERLEAEVYAEYEKTLKRSNAVDFDDLLLLVLKLLKENPVIRERLQNRFKYIVVDEFQDTNTVQNEILKQLAASHKNICVCGDDDQSIVRP